MKLKEWFTDESKWTKGYYYQNKYGYKTNKIEEFEDKAEISACCLLGAVSLYYRYLREYDNVCDKIYNWINTDRLGGRLRIDEYNDSEYTTFNDIKKLVNELDI